MKNEDKQETRIHRYGLRMPESLFKIVEDLAWESRLSINMKIVDLIVEALHEKLWRRVNIDLSFASWRDDAKNDFAKIDQNDPTEFDKFASTLRNAVLEYDEWKNSGKDRHL